MIVAQLWEGEKDQWHYLYSGSCCIATMWGIPTCLQPGASGVIMVTFRHRRQISGFWHVDKTFYMPATPDELIAMGIVDCPAFLSL